MNYTIHLTEKQVVVIKAALEDYFRTRMGQFFDLPDDLAFDGYDRKTHDDIEFNERIARRDAGKALLDAAYKLMHPKWDLPKSEDSLIAQDMWGEIKHALWKQRPQADKDAIPWCVDADKPLHLSGEPRIKVEADA